MATRLTARLRRLEQHLSNEAGTKCPTDIIVWVMDARNSSLFAAEIEGGPTLKRLPQEDDAMFKERVSRVATERAHKERPGEVHLIRIWESRGRTPPPKLKQDYRVIGLDGRYEGTGDTPE